MIITVLDNKQITKMITTLDAELFLSLSHSYCGSITTERTARGYFLCKKVFPTGPGDNISESLPGDGVDFKLY